MEISPIIMAKMLLVAFLFGAQSGAFFDAGRVLKALFFGDVKSERVRKLYGAELPFSKRIFKTKERKSARILKNILIFFCDISWVIYSCLCLLKICQCQAELQLANCMCPEGMELAEDNVTCMGMSCLCLRSGFVDRGRG